MKSSGKPCKTLCKFVAPIHCPSAQRTKRARQGRLQPKFPTRPGLDTSLSLVCIRVESPGKHVPPNVFVQTPSQPRRQTSLALNPRQGPSPFWPPTPDPGDLRSPIRKSISARAHHIARGRLLFEGHQDQGRAQNRLLLPWRAFIDSGKFVALRRGQFPPPQTIPVLMTGGRISRNQRLSR